MILRCFLRKTIWSIVVVVFLYLMRALESVSEYMMRALLKKR